MNNRRAFLKSVGVTASLAAAPVLLSTPTSAAPPSPPPVGRIVTGRHYGIELDNTMAGWVDSADVSLATGIVVTEQTSPESAAKKHIGGVKYEDIKVTCGTGMSKALYSWIKNSFDNKPIRKSGSIIAADFNYRDVQRISFMDALIAEIGFPALDAASKDAAKMTIAFAPEFTKRNKASGGTIPRGPVQKRWLTSNFRLSIDGLDQACSRVNKIEALVIKQLLLQDQTGGSRDFGNSPGNLELPDLVFTAAEAAADELYAWHESFIVEGNNTADQEKTGKLEFLSPNLTDVLFTLNFSGLGIFKLTPDKMEAGSENIRRVKAELYCEQISFNASDAAIWA